MVLRKQGKNFISGLISLVQVSKAKKLSLCTFPPFKVKKLLKLLEVNCSFCLCTYVDGFTFGCLTLPHLYFFSLNCSNLLLSNSTRGCFITVSVKTQQQEASR